MIQRWFCLLQQVKVRNATNLMLALICAVFCSCDSSNVPVPKRPVSMLDLIELNQRNAEKEALMIDSVSRSWGWQMQGGFLHQASGIQLIQGPLLDDPRTIEKGDTLSWVGRVMLMDSTLLFDWTVDEPLSLVVDASNWPVGFHEMAKQMVATNALSALVPSHLAWGLSGWPPLVPQDAVLWMEIEFFELHPVAAVAAVASLAGNWNDIIDAFESGLWPSDGSWIQHPELVPSPCISWNDSTAIDETGFVNGAQVEISMRTFRSSVFLGNELDLGWNQWSFRVGDDQQVLPILEGMMRQSPSRTRWECHCPVSYAFGNEGVPSVGLAPNDVVGFQWEWSVVSDSVKDASSALIAQ